MYKIFHGYDFTKQCSKLDGHYLPIIRKFEEHLAIEPFLGKPLGTRYLREKKFNGMRLIFLVYPEFKKILIVGISNKKDQQDLIDFTKDHFEDYNKTVEKL